MTYGDYPYPQFSVGPYRITILPVGQFALDGGAMFGVVPRVLWERMCPVDDQHRIPLALNCLLVEYESEKILLDTGIGMKFSAKYQDMYGITQECNIVKTLQPLKVQPNDITQVYFTHLHFDHSGGSTMFDEHGVAKPTFMNAQHVIHQGEWADAHEPSPKSKASYLHENYQPLHDLGQLTLVDGPETEILPDLWLKTSGGHTQFHQVLILDRPEGGFIYWGDVLPTHHHLRIPFVMAYDLYPVDTMAVKQKLLLKAYEQGWFNIFEHDLDVPYCLLDVDPVKNTYMPKIMTPSSSPRASA